MTEQCLLCGRAFHVQIALRQYFSLKPLQPPCVCERCQQALGYRLTDDNCCSGCGRHFARDGKDQYHRIALENESGCYCLDCSRWLANYPAELVRHQALCDYTPTLRDWLHQYKYTGDMRLARVVVDYLQAYRRLHKRAHWLVLPSAPVSLERRQFHPTKELLIAAGISCVCPFDYIGDGVKQASKNRAQRLALKQPFRLNSARLPTNNKVVEWLLFDDVYTTGATMLAAKLLLWPEAKNHEIVLNSISIARESLS